MDSLIRLTECYGLWKSFLFSLLTLIVTWVVYKIIKEKLSPLHKIPGPPGYPIIGNMFNFIKRKDHVNLMREWSEKYGSIFKHNPGWAGTRVNVTGPENIKHVLITHRHKYAKSKTIKLFVPSVGNGILSCSHEDHVRQHKMVAPAFSYNNLKDMTTIFKEVACKLVQRWQDALSSSGSETCVVEAQKDLNHCTLDIIGQCAFGCDFDTVLSGDNQITKAFTSIIEVMDFKHLILKRIIPFYKYFYTKGDKARKVTDDKVMEIIHQKLNSGNSESTKKDLLDHLLESYSNDASAKDVEEMRSQVFTFLLAGHETSSVSLAWTLYELAKNPDIQTKAREDINSVLGRDTKVEFSNLDQMKYLGNVIKESLRLHSPVFHVVRQTVEDDVLGGYLIPKGTVVAVGIQSTQLLSKYWKDPYSFNPDRFEEKDGQSPTFLNTFLPFSIGARSCLGNKFALAEMKVILATLLQNFIFTEVPGLEVKPSISITVRPHPHLLLQVTKAR